MCSSKYPSIALAGCSAGSMLVLNRHANFDLSSCNNLHFIIVRTKANSYLVMVSKALNLICTFGGAIILQLKRSCKKESSKVWSYFIALSELRHEGHHTVGLETLRHCTGRGRPSDHLAIMHRPGLADGLYGVYVDPDLVYLTGYPGRPVCDGL